VEPDSQLLEAWARGDARAGREFYGRWADRVVRFFARKVECDPADLVQRTFLKCLAAQKEQGALEDPPAMLFAVARNELYDHYRRKMKDGARFAPETTSLADTGAGPSTAMARAEEERLLVAALGRVPLDDQLALELYYLEEMPMESVARVLGVTKSAAINRVHRAREAVREALRALEKEPGAADRAVAGLETWARSRKAE
jgi:RNA polymerase sigma-70 factor (ECF subfamily)